APPEQYARLGLPATGPIDVSHLVLSGEGAPVPAAAPAVETVGAGAVAEGFEGTPVGTLTVRDILADPAYKQVAREVLGPLVDGPLPPDAQEMTLVQIATVTFGMVPPEALSAINDWLTALAD